MKNLIKRAIKIMLSLLNRAWYIFCRLLPLKDRVLFYSIRADGKLLDNAKAVFDAYDGKKIIFANKLPHSRKIKFLAFYYLLTSKVIVTDDYVRYLSEIKLRKNQKVFQIWHACGAFKKFGLDAPIKVTQEVERATHSQYSAVAVTAEPCRKFYAGAFGISEETCIAVGLPRTDRLFTDAKKMRENILSQYSQLSDKHIYLYCPTFREIDGQRIEYNPDIDWQKLSGELSEDEIFVIRRHPHMNYDLIKGEYDNIIDLSDASTLDLTAACDVMITDYSSVVYDACLLDVPTVFYCPDYKEYERGFYLKFPDDLPGELITESEKLLSAIRQTKENPPVSRIEKFRNEQTAACDGKATERTVAIIKDWMK